MADRIMVEGGYYFGPDDSLEKPATTKNSRDTGSLCQQT
jgi:hypothetical protein